MLLNCSTSLSIYLHPKSEFTPSRNQIFFSEIPVLVGRHSKYMNLLFDWIIHCTLFYCMHHNSVLIDQKFIKKLDLYYFVYESILPIMPILSWFFYLPFPFLVFDFKKRMLAHSSSFFLIAFFLCQLFLKLILYYRK